MRTLSPFSLAIVSTIALTLVIGGALLFSHTPSQLIPEKSSENLRQLKSFATAEKLVKNGESVEALTLIKQYEEEIRKQSKMGKKWVNLLIELSTQTKNTPQLVILFEQYPEQFLFYEQAALLVGGSLLDKGQVKEYEKLRQLWLYSESNIAPWLHLDADRLLLLGKREKAISLLKQQRLEGEDESNRFVRLGLMHLHEDEKTAWDFLHQAYLTNPKNADILTYQAQILERQGKHPHAVRAYLSAIELEPENPRLKEQMGDYYQRQRKYSAALETWKEALASPTSDTLWVKALFWGKVCRPLSFTWNTSPSPEGTLRPAINYLLKLPRECMWDEKEFAKIAEADSLAAHNQELFWLRLIEKLNRYEEESALDHLTFNPFSENSLSPNLEIALQQILFYRKHRTFNQELPALSLQQPRSGKFLSVLNEAIENPKAPLPFGLETLLQRQEAPALAFQEEGWIEAAIYLHPLSKIPEAVPSWVTKQTVSLLLNHRSQEEALSFAEKQEEQEAIILSIARSYLSHDEPAEAKKILKRIAYERSDEACQAAWLLSLLHIKEENYSEAKELLSRHPRLSREVKGKELLARISLLEKDYLTAYEIYQSIEKNSWEAKSFLAKRAFKEEEWERAKELTEELCQQFPNDQTLRKNLTIIDEKLARFAPPQIEEELAG